MAWVLGSAALLLAVAAPGSTDSALDLRPPTRTRAQMEAALNTTARWRFVYGTRDPDAAPRLREHALRVARRLFGGDSSWVVADRDLDAAAMARTSVVLVGGPGLNTWTRRLLPALPVRFGPAHFEWQGTAYREAGDALRLVYPNPLAPERFLLLTAGNSVEATIRRGGFLFGTDDWRITRGGELLRSGVFAQSAASPWRYERTLDRDREADRAAYSAAMVRTTAPGIEVRAPAADSSAGLVARAGSALLARLDRFGLAAPAGSPALAVTLYPSLERKGAMTRDTRAEHVASGVVHMGRVSGRDGHDLAALAEARLRQAGAGESRFTTPAGVWLAGRFDGEPLGRALARLSRGGLLPDAQAAATRPSGWRSPRVWTPARAVLLRAFWEAAPASRRREVLLSLTRRDPPGTLDSLCARAGLAPGEVARRYSAISDSLARAELPGLALRAPRPWSPRDGFQRGVCFAHSVNMEGGYLSRAAADELRGLARRGADWVSLTPFGYLPSLTTPEVRPSAEGGPDEESDESLVESIAQARASGLRVWLKPHLWTRGWIGDLAFSERDWPRFFDAYRECILHWALLAEREGVDGLFVGHELVSSTRLHPGRWRTLIAQVRRVYSGTLSYGANWDEVAHVPFWDALDVISVSFYHPLAESPTRDVAVLRRGAVRALSGLRAIAARTQRPVLLAEVGYAPTPIAPVRPWEEGPPPADLEAQRACYEAVVAALDSEVWVAGVHWWKWFSSPAVAGAGDTGFSPRGKPAEAVFNRALREWQGRPVRLAKR